MKVNKCGNKGKDSRPKEQLINGTNDEDIKTEIIRELSTIKKTNANPSEHGLCWARTVQAQTPQKALLY